ncbi:MAG: PAS domain-containing sensor histidine kinase [Deltaproteobacteria bacterium]|nr:PAS domain-containing sensor histidine kinase [Deltaproteobacteria bacterium]
MISIALMNWQIRAALNERIKELTCLYQMGQLSDQPHLSLDEILQGAVGFLPPAWQYPDVASARIVFDDKTFALPGFMETQDKQSAPIVVKGTTRGIVEVVYTEQMPQLDEGPFLKEEKELIESIARELSLIIERHLYKEEEARLLDQLRHADRLSVIGQLSAAVAHELNEPLANILGFAQLALKSEELTKQVREDIEKVLNASLHARKITRKLLSFARPAPPEKSLVSLNHVVEETLYFFESRCTKEGIVLERSLSEDIRDIYANSEQLMQVATNLLVNAMHAMPGGGKLKIGTCSSQEYVSLIIEDTGTGMSKEVMEKIFTPFFTNKSVGHGTGLGLPVVHGIVIAHGGSIRVDSEVGRGTRFEIRFPLSKNSVEGDLGKDKTHDWA